MSANLSPIMENLNFIKNWAAEEFKNPIYQNRSDESAYYDLFLQHFSMAYRGACMYSREFPEFKGSLYRITNDMVAIIKKGSKPDWYRCADAVQSQVGVHFMR